MCNNLVSCATNDAFFISYFGQCCHHPSQKDQNKTWENTGKVPQETLNVTIGEIKTDVHCTQPSRTYPKML